MLYLLTSGKSVSININHACVQYLILNKSQCTNGWLSSWHYTSPSLAEVSAWVYPPPPPLLDSGGTYEHSLLRDTPCHRENWRTLLLFHIKQSTLNRELKPLSSSYLGNIMVTPIRCLFFSIEKLGKYVYVNHHWPSYVAIPQTMHM